MNAILASIVRQACKFGFPIIVIFVNENIAVELQWLNKTMIVTISI